MRRMPADLDQRPVSHRRDDDRIEARREHAERAKVAMIVVIVAEQDHADLGQIVEPHRGLPDAARAEEHGPRAFGVIGSVRRFPAAVWIRNVEWPMKVTTASASSRGAGRRAGASMRAGHGVRRSISMRGTAVNGCGVGPVGLKNRCPSK